MRKILLVTLLFVLSVIVPMANAECDPNVRYYWNNGTEMHLVRTCVDVWFMRGEANRVPVPTEISQVQDFILVNNREYFEGFDTETGNWALYLVSPSNRPQRITDPAVMSAYNIFWVDAQHIGFYFDGGDVAIMETNTYTITQMIHGPFLDIIVRFDESGKIFYAGMLQDMTPVTSEDDQPTS